MPEASEDPTAAREDEPDDDDADDHDCEREWALGAAVARAVHAIAATDPEYVRLGREVDLAIDAFNLADAALDRARETRKRRWQAIVAEYEGQHGSEHVWPDLRFSPYAPRDLERL